MTLTPGMLLALGCLGIFVAIAVLLATVGGLTVERAQVNRSMAAIAALTAAPASMRKELNPSFDERVLRPFYARLTRLGRRMTPEGRLEKMRRKLDLAGNPPNWDLDRVLAMKALMLVVGAALGLLAPLAFGLSPVVPLLAGPGLALLGYLIPDFWLYQLGYNRKEKTRKELPDAIDLLSISVEAGLAFDAALAQVAKNTEGPLAEEFFRVLQEMQIGLGRSAALRALGERTQVEELRAFVSSIVQADALGVPITNILRVQAKEMRVKRTQRAEEQAQKVPVKILFPLIFFILPALLIVIVGPAGISIVRSFGGGLG